MIELFTNINIGMKLEDLQAKIIMCGKCSHKDEIHTPLPGFGSENPDLLVVGQHPGKGEDKLGRPYSMRAGEFIKSYFYNIGLSDENIYWTNIACCPIPIGEEVIPHWQISNCAIWLEDHIDVLRPKLIVGVGEMVRIRMFKPKRMNKQRKGAGSVLEARFKIWDYRGYPFIIVTNPAGILRRKSFEREMFTEDVEKDFQFLNQLKERIHEGSSLL